ncbi:MAG: enoyl-CoA hydratase/isomerase family protein [Burkholderiales bacterium]|nr:enoyl-CoA hydratase/isomerase family protein [Burkholderiales bacterium]
MSYQFIDYSVTEQVATIALNRPERRNALDLTMRAEFADAIGTALTDDAVRVLLLAGNGGHFCAGGDMRSMNPDQPIDGVNGRRRMKSLHKALRALLETDKPVIAAVDGSVYGGGFGIALMADMIVATARARFCLSFVRVGLVPDCGVLYTLPRVIGLNRAKALVMSGREIDGERAREMGIVDEVVAPEALRAHAQALGRTLASGSADMLAMAKHGLNLSLESGMNAMFEYEATAQGVAFSSDFHRNAVREFLNRSRKDKP